MNFCKEYQIWLMDNKLEIRALIQFETLYRKQNIEEKRDMGLIELNLEVTSEQFKLIF